MEQKVYAIAANLGDGSFAVRFFAEPFDVEETGDFETYGEGEFKVLTFPEDLDLAACGIRFSTL